MLMSTIRAFCEGVAERLIDKGYCVTFVPGDASLARCYTVSVTAGVKTVKIYAEPDAVKLVCEMSYQRGRGTVSWISAINEKEILKYLATCDYGDPNIFDTIDRCVWAVTNLQFGSRDFKSCIAGDSRWIPYVTA